MTEQTTPTNDDFGPIALLAGLTGSNTRQIELLKIITDPANSDGRIDGETHAEIAESYEEHSGYMGFDYHSEVQTVADFLYNHYAGDEQAPQFSFGFDCNCEGEIGGYVVSAGLGTDWETRIVLAKWSDIKHSTVDREATGLKAALAIAEMLDDDYRTVVAKARRRGLLAADPNLVENAARCLAAYDAVPANDDIDAEVMSAMRDSLAALIAAQGSKAPTANN